MTWFKHGKTLVTFVGHIITATAVFFLVGLGVCGLHWMRELFGTFGIGHVFLFGSSPGLLGQSQKSFVIVFS